MPEATEEQMYRFTVEIVFDLWNRLVYQSKKTDRLQAELDEVKADRDFIRKACEDRDKLATELAALKAEKPTPRTDDEPAGKLYAAWCSFWSVWQNNKSLGVATRMTIDNWIGYEVENLRKAIEAAPTKPVTDAVRAAWVPLDQLIRGSRFEDHGSLLTSCGAFIRFKAAIKSLLGPAKETT